MRRRTSNFVLKKSVVDGLQFPSLDGSAVGGRRLAVFEERKKKRGGGARWPGGAGVVVVVGGHLLHHHSSSPQAIAGGAAGGGLGAPAGCDEQDTNRQRKRWSFLLVCSIEQRDGRLRYLNSDNTFTWHVNAGTFRQSTYIFAMDSSYWCMPRCLPCRTE